MATHAEPAGAGTLTPAQNWARRRARAIAVVGGAVAALVVWLVAKYLADVELRAPAPGTQGLTDVGAGSVLFGAVLWSLVGWGLLALLERFLGRARTVWVWIVIVLLLLSLAGPLTATGATVGTKIALSIMHVAVAAVVIPIFARTSPRR